MDDPPLRLEEITADRTFSVTELAESAAKNIWTKDKKQCRVCLGDQEAAFVTFDTFDPNQLTL